MSAVASSSIGVRQSRQAWWAGYTVVVGGGMVIAAIARRRFTEPYLGLSLALLGLLVLGWLIRPRQTLYATLFLTAISDQVTVSWFPFAKNLSSRESISYLADSLTISPLEIALYLGAGISILRSYARDRTILPRTALTWPIIAFTAFVVYGYARGLSSGGDVRVSIFEGRALFYILLVFVIVANECPDEADRRSALWAVLTGVVVQALLSISYLGSLDASAKDSLESLNEHGSTLGHGLMIITLLAILFLGVRGAVRTWMLVVGLAPVTYIFFVGQRRSGVAALLVASIALMVGVYWRRRRAFFVLAPMLLLALTAYLGAFWNSESSVAFPAQAIKGIIAPGGTSAADQSSDWYRLIEAYDLNFTVRAAPLTGIGFGQPFYRPVPLPDISWFEFNAYIPHNSVLWIWIKLGFGGFVTLFYLFAKALLLGADRVRRAASGIDSVTALVAPAFLCMYAAYSYVDISWDARNTVFLGLCLAMCAPASEASSTELELPDPDREPVAV